MFNRRRKKKEDKGFLCPTCMQIFASAEEVQTHFKEYHNDQDGLISENQGEGFLCPMCKKSLVSPEELQSHYDAEHSEEATAADTHHAWNGEITGQEIHELRKKLEQLQTQLRGSEESRTILSSEVFNSEQKVTQYSLQLGALKVEKESIEAERSRLTNDVVNLKEKVNDNESRQRILEDYIKTLKEQLDEKSAFIKHLETQFDQRETARVKQLQSSFIEKESDLDKMKTTMEKMKLDVLQLTEDKQKLQDQLTELTSVAGERQATIIHIQEELSYSDKEKKRLQDALQVTQNYLTDAQTSVTKIQSKLDQSSKSLEECTVKISHLQAALEEKTETARQAQKEADKSKEAYKELANEHEKVKTLLKEKNKEVEELQRMMESWESTTQTAILQKDQEISKMKVTVEKLEADFGVKSTEISDLENQLAASRKAFENERHFCDELKAQVIEQEDLLEERARKLTKSEEKVKDLDLKITSMAEERQRLEKEKQDLIDKIDAGEGANELINQMKQENNCLLEKLSSLESTLQSQASENSSNTESLHKRIREVKGQLQESEVKSSKLEAVLEEKSTKLKTLQQKLQEIESDLKAKTELLLATEATKASQIVDLENQLQAVKNSVEKTGAQLSAAKLQISHSSQEVAEKKEKITVLESRLEERTEKLFQSRQQVIVKDRELKEMSSKLEEAQARKRELEEMLAANKQILDDTKVKLEKIEQDLEEERRSRAAEKDNLCNTLDKVTGERTHLQEKVDDLNSRLAETEKKQSERGTELVSILNNLAATQNQLKQVQEELLQTKESYDGQLVSLTSQLEREKASGVEGKAQLLKQVASQAKEINSLKDETMAYISQVSMLNTQIQQQSSDIDTLKERIEMEGYVLQSEVLNLQKSLGETKAEKEEYKRDMERFQDLLEIEQKERQKEVSAVTGARDLLLQQVTGLQSEVVRLKEESRQWSEQVIKVRQEAEEVQKSLQHDNSIIQEKLTLQLSTFEALRKEKEEMEAEYENQCTLLSQNLTTVRADLTAAENNLEELTRVNDQLQGEKLELQDKLEHGNNERRVLVERCASSERECERQREHVTEQKIKLEDIHRALQDIGRENQILQIMTTTVKGRKWTQDDDATECTACGKLFSVTNRKHHCRNCGHIFCGDCSNKTAQVPTRRKPSRVCDTCYRELQPQKRIK